MEFEVYARGLCYVSVCTSLTVEEATARVNLEEPTGIASPWVMSTAPTFSGGEPMPLPCSRHPGNWHLLFVC